MCKYTLFPIAAFCFSCVGLAQQKQNFTQTSELETVYNDTVKNKKGVILQEVIVTSSQQKLPVSVGKGGIRPMDLPQAAAVINGATIDKQQINSVTDLLKNVNGVYIMGATGGYQEEIASRGSALGSSNTFKNGVRYFSGMRTEFSGIERAEFLKGSAAILYGNVSPGGVLNLVTKKPRFDFGGEAGFRFGSFNSIKPIFDLYGGLDAKKTTAFRINGAYEKADSFRNEVHSESFYVNPSFVAKLGSRTELLVEADYTKDRRTPDFGAGIINYEIVEIPRERFLGVSWGYFDAQQVSATATLSHKISENWDLAFINSYRFYNTDLFSNTRPNSGTAITATGDWKRSVQRSEINDNYFLQQLDLKGIFHTGSISHQVLAGVDRELYKTKTWAYKNAAYDITPINIFNDYNASAELPIPTLDRNTLTGAPVSRVGVYAQDLISFTHYLKLLVGLRYTYQDTESNVLTYNANGTTATKITNNYDDALSPRIGLVVQPSEDHSVFASYSNSFQVNTGTDIDKNALKPSIIDQYEVGVKNKFFDERLFANLTVYRITNSNLAQTSLLNGNTDTNIKELTGETRSQGAELDIVANPARGLSLMAGYSYNETKYTQSNTYLVGSELRYNPKNTANLSVSYTFETTSLKGLELGLINTYIGQRYAGRSTRLTTPNDTYRLIPLDDYVQVDATLGYVYHRWAIRSKLSNIFNELNYNIHDDNSLNPIAPRNYSVTLTYKF